MTSQNAQVTSKNYKNIFYMDRLPRAIQEANKIINKIEKGEL